MTTMELRKQLGDKVAPILEWSDKELSYLYLMLYNKGYRTDGLEYRIDHMLRMEADSAAAKL